MIPLRKEVNKLKKILLALLIVMVFVLPVLAQYQSPPISEKDIIDFIGKVGVQVRIPVYQVYRPLSFYKFEEGVKLTDEEFRRLNEDEKKWYQQGYTVKYGEWIGDDKDEEDRIVKTAIYGTGTIIYSAELPEALQSQDKGIYCETLVMTNYHVVQPLVDKLNLGTKAEPINVYEEKDYKTSVDPPKVEIIAGARPVAQKYGYFVDKESKETSWIATVNKASIKVSVNQYYDIEAVVPPGGYDKGLDVGILQIKNVAFQPYATFRETECEVGEKVWIRHAPLALAFSTDRGYINQTHLDLGIGTDGLGWMDQVKIDIPSAPGSSGSGIFDQNGFLIALFHGGLIHQTGAGYAFIEGGHLAHEGKSVAEWLNWRGFSYIFDRPLYKDQQDILNK